MAKAKNSGYPSKMQFGPLLIAAKLPRIHAGVAFEQAGEINGVCIADVVGVVSGRGL